MLKETVLSERKVQNCEKARAFECCAKKGKPAESTEEEELEKQKTRRGQEKGGFSEGRSGRQWHATESPVG